MTTRDKRIAILNEINSLEKERCNVCASSAINSESINCQCNAAISIRKCGERLIDLSRSHRKKRIDQKIKLARETGLTMELYQYFRENEFTNKQLCKAIRMKESDYYDWKFDNGLIKERRTAKTDGKANYKTLRNNREITKEQFNTAVANGISRATVRKRVRQAGWDIERAITEPANALKKELDKWAATAAANGVSLSTLRARIHKGESVEDAARRPLGTYRKQATT